MACNRDANSRSAARELPVLYSVEEEPYSYQFCGAKAKLYPRAFDWVVECCNDSCRANCTALASKDAVDSWNSKDCIRRGRWYNREKGVSLHGA